VVQHARQVMTPNSSSSRVIIRKSWSTHSHIVSQLLYNYALFSSWRGEMSLCTYPFSSWKIVSITPYIPCPTLTPFFSFNRADRCVRGGKCHLERNKNGPRLWELCPRGSWHNSGWKDCYQDQTIEKKNKRFVSN
jgi:hypothetical protein